MLDLNTYKTQLLSYDEYSITLDRLRMDHLYEEELFFVVAFHTGLKYRDLIKLEWKDVFNKDEFIWGNTLKKKQFTLSWKNTDAKARIFYLYDKLGVSDLNSLVFANKSGKLHSNAYINLMLGKVRDKYDLPIKKLYASTFRLMFACFMYDNAKLKTNAIAFLNSYVGGKTVDIATNGRHIPSEEIEDALKSMNIKYRND